MDLNMNSSSVPTMVPISPYTTRITQPLNLLVKEESISDEESDDVGDSYQYKEPSDAEHKSQVMITCCQCNCEQPTMNQGL